MTGLGRRTEGTTATTITGTTQTIEATNPQGQTERVRRPILRGGHGLIPDHLSGQGLQTGLGHPSSQSHLSGQGHLLDPGHQRGQKQAPV